VGLRAVPLDEDFVEAVDVLDVTARRADVPTMSRDTETSSHHRKAVFARPTSAIDR